MVRVDYLKVKPSIYMLPTYFEPTGLIRQNSGIKKVKALFGRSDPCIDMSEYGLVSK